MKYFLALIVVLFVNSICVSQDIQWNANDAFTTSNISSKSMGNPAVIRINSKINVSGKVDVPKNITLDFSLNGSLTIVDDETRLTISGPIKAGKQTIFDLSANGVTSNRYESVSNIKLTNTKTFFPEWWGIMPNIIPGQNGDTKSKKRHFTHLKEMMLDIAASGGGTIKFSEGVYYIRDIVIDSDNISVIGEGKKTILRFDRDNYVFSTRRGGIFTIQGPTLEKYYSKVFPEGISIAGNFLYDTEQKTIENIIVKDLVIEWNEISTKEDPAMNGLTIVNAKNVTIDNVHVDLFGSNRAFYIGTIFDGDVTENITIKNSSCVNSRTGVFILHGYDNVDTPRKKMAIGNVLIENNIFNVVPIPELDIKNDHIEVKYLDQYACGVYFIGNEYTSSFIRNGEMYERETGSFIIKNNVFENADFGIRSWLPNQNDNKELNQEILIEGNLFKNFKYVGIFVPFENATIKNNTFLTSQLTPLPFHVSESNEEGFIATAIHIAKAPWKIFKTQSGPENIKIINNEIKGCFLGVTPIVLQPNEGATISLENNKFNYDQSCPSPVNDIEIITNRRKFRTKRATINLSNNKINTEGNQNPSEASLLLNVRRKKFITLLEK